jgi:hypothetical protein
VVRYVALSFPQSLTGHKQLEFLTREWKTGTYVAAQFFEKDVAKSYEIHVQDLQNWSKLNPSFSENVRLKWTKCAWYVFI